MIRIMGILYAAMAAVVIATAPISNAHAAPVFAGSGNIMRDTVPVSTETVRMGGRRGGGFRGGGYRRGGFRGGGYYRQNRAFRPYRAHRRAYYGRPAYYGAPVYYGRPAYAGRRCFVRPARWIWTPYGYRLRHARRVCRW